VIFERNEIIEKLKMIIEIEKIKRQEKIR